MFDIFGTFQDDNNLKKQNRPVLARFFSPILLKVQGQDNRLDEIKADKEGICELSRDIGTCKGGIPPEICNDEHLDGQEHSYQRKASNVIEAEDIDHNQDADMSFDNEGYNDENDIAMKKNAFLGSQCTYSQDSLATTDWRYLNLSTTCKNGGPLLACHCDY
ncbi:unnamed protein product [Fraxinus pennsylvanica]|uniref:Uncharacterized protein n=1 Tax=Fraxinus pennsylvanica TaxID=56036 RepID=A0AAD1Z6C4_9LAMI|nr:unnamed protein product [Fraxinus pennsylvanica]